MTPKQKGLLVLWILVAIVIVVAGYFGLMQYKKTHPSFTQETQNNQPAQHVSATPTPPQITLVKNDQIPEGLPANLPYETNVQVLQNFTLTDPQTGQVQATRVYVTAKTLQQNFDLFKKFFTDNKWNISNVVDQPNLKSISSFKNMNELDILIAHYDNPNQNTVNITYRYVPTPSATTTPAQ